MPVVNQQTSEDRRRAPLPDMGRLVGAALLGFCVLIAELQYLSWSQDHRLAEASALLEYRAEAARDALLRSVDDATEELEAWAQSKLTAPLPADLVAGAERPRGEPAWDQLTRSLPAGWSTAPELTEAKSASTDAYPETDPGKPFPRIEPAGPGGREAVLLAAFPSNPSEAAGSRVLVLSRPLGHELNRLSEGPLPGALRLETLAAEPDGVDSTDLDSRIGSSCLLPALGVRLTAEMSREEAMEPIRQTRLALFALDGVLLVALVLMVFARPAANEAAGAASPVVQRSAAGVLVFTVSIGCALGLWRFAATVVDEYERERFDETVEHVRQDLDARLRAALAEISRRGLASAPPATEAATRRGAQFTALLIEDPPGDEGPGGIRVVTPSDTPEVLRPADLRQAARRSSSVAPVLASAAWRGTDGKERNGLATLAPATGSIRMWAAAFYRLDDLLAPPAWLRPAEVGYRVYSGPASEATLVYQQHAGGEDQGREPLFERSALLSAGGETWPLQFEAAPSFARPMSRVFPALLLVGVTALGALLAIFASSGLSAGERLWKRAKSVERRSKLTAARSRSVLESVSGAVIEFREDGRIDAWSKGAERLFGRPASEMLGRSVREALPRLSWDALDARPPQEALQPSIHTEARRADGSETAVAVAIGSARAGRKKYYTACISEVLDPPRREAKIKWDRDWPEDWVWDLEANRLRLSAAARSLLGLISNREEFGPDAWFDRLLPEERAESLVALSEQLDSSSERFKWQHEVSLADRSSRRVEVYGLIERTGGGQARRIHGAVRLIGAVARANAVSSPS